MLVKTPTVRLFMRKAQHAIGMARFAIQPQLAPIENIACLGQGFQADLGQGIAAIFDGKQRRAHRLFQLLDMPPDRLPCADQFGHRMAEVQSMRQRHERAHHLEQKGRSGVLLQGLGHGCARLNIGHMLVHRQGMVHESPGNAI